MFDITYISTDDRKLLESLKYRLDREVDPTLQEELREQIQDIEDTRKPLTECSFEELTELKEFLFKKYIPLVKTGIRNQASLYLKRQMQRVEILQSRKIREDDADSIKIETKKKKPVNERSKKSQPDAAPRSFQDKWAIRIGDDD